MTRNHNGYTGDSGYILTCIYALDTIATNFLETNFSRDLISAIRSNAMTILKSLFYLEIPPFKTDFSISFFLSSLKSLFLSFIDHTSSVNKVLGRSSLPHNSL